MNSSVNDYEVIFNFKSMKFPIIYRHTEYVSAPAYTASLNYIILALCYGAPSTAYQRKRSDTSVLSRALLMSAMLMTESCATEVRSCPWPQCDSASG